MQEETELGQVKPNIGLPQFGPPPVFVLCCCGYIIALAGQLDRLNPPFVIEALGDQSEHVHNLSYAHSQEVALDQYPPLEQFLP